MTATTINARQTKYCTAIKDFLSQSGHASNATILSELRKSYPDLSATTVHRATSRLASRNEISIAPSDIDGSMRYDINLAPHDHFMCTSCGLLYDINLPKSLVNEIKSQIKGCSINGSVIVSGLCNKCKKEEL